MRIVFGLLKVGRLPSLFGLKFYGVTVYHEIQDEVEVLWQCRTIGLDGIED